MVMLIGSFQKLGNDGNVLPHPCHSRYQKARVSCDIGWWMVAGTVGPLMFAVFVKFIGLVSRFSMLEYGFVFF